MKLSSRARARKQTTQAGPTATPRPATRVVGPMNRTGQCSYDAMPQRTFATVKGFITVYILIHLLIVYCVVLVPHTFVVYLCILLVLFVAKVEC